MLTWTKTDQKWYLLILLFVKCWPWATPAARLSLKLLQQTRLDSLLFSTWFLCCKAAAKHWSYWNNKLTILTDQRFKLISNTDLLCVCTSASAHDLETGPGTPISKAPWKTDEWLPAQLSAAQCANVGSEFRNLAVMLSQTPDVHVLNPGCRCTSPGN